MTAPCQSLAPKRTACVKEPTWITLVLLLGLLPWPHASEPLSAAHAAAIGPEEPSSASITLTVDLRDLARRTVHTHLVLPASPGPLLAAVDHIAREIRNVYTIGYAPPDHDGQYHRVRVTIDLPNAKHLTIRTRPGYFAAATVAGASR